MPAIQETLDERKVTHGPFAEYAKVAQRLKAIMQASPNWSKLSNTQREGLDMIQGKVARMLTGDVKFVDTARDISGYAERIREDMEVQEGATDSQTRKIKLVNGAWELV